MTSWKSYTGRNNIQSFLILGSLMFTPVFLFLLLLLALKIRLIVETFTATKVYIGAKFWGGGIKLNNSIEDLDSSYWY